MKYIARLVEAGAFLGVLLYLIAWVLVLLLIAKFVFDIVKLIKQYNNIKRLRDSMSYDVFSVEGEIISYTEKKIGRMDTKYYVNIMYMVGTMRFYKEVVLHNRGSIRVGQKITLLCDDNDPSNAIVQDGSEEDSLKGLIFAMAIELGIAIFGIIRLSLARYGI